MTSTYSFPIYRKYLNNSSFFKVISLDEFEELKKLPTGYSLFSFKVKILPDRNFIQDMLYDFHLHWEEIEESEYEEIKAKVTNQ